MDEAAFSKFYQQGRNLKLEEAIALISKPNPQVLLT
jgi:hypothetical protein